MVDIFEISLLFWCEQHFLTHMGTFLSMLEVHNSFNILYLSKLCIWQFLFNRFDSGSSLTIMRSKIHLRKKDLSLFHFSKNRQL